MESLPLDIDHDASDATHADRFCLRLNRMREITLPQTGSPDDKLVLVDVFIWSVN